MTSKNLFINLMKENAKRRISALSLAILGFLFCLPVFGAICISRWMERLAQGRTTFEKIILSYSRDVLGMENDLIVLLVFTLAILMGISGYSYLFSKAKTDLYHSIPVKRNTLFFVSYVNGILFFVIPYAVTLALATILGKAYGLINTVSLSTMLTSFLVTSLCYIMIYTTVIAATMLTGNVIIALFAAGTFLLYGPLVKLLFIECQETFFHTYYFQYNFDSIKRFYSPASVYLNLIAELSKKDGSIAGLLLEAVIITVLMALLCLFLYRKRPSEAAGHAIAFPKICPYVKLMIIIPASLFGGLFFREICEKRSANDIWFVFGLLITIILTHAIMEIVFQFDFKAALHHPTQLLLGIAIASLIAVIFRFDLVGYDRYLPKAASLSSVSINFNALDTGITYVDLSQYSEEDDSYSKYYSILADPSEYRLKNIHITDIDASLSLAQSGIETVKQMRANGNTLRDEMESDERDSRYTYVDFCYHLKNGENVYRSYPIEIAKNMEHLNKIYTSEEFKKGEFPILSIDDYKKEKFLYYSPLGAYSLSELSEQEMSELLSTYQRELLAQDFTSLTESTPIGHIASKRSYTSPYYEYTYYEGYIYPSFHDTIALLEKHRIPYDDYMNTDNITSILVSYYKYDDLTGDPMEAEQTYEDRADIEELMNVLIPSENFYENGLKSDEPYVEATVTYNKIPAGFSDTCFFTFTKGSIPEHVQKDLNYSK